MDEENLKSWISQPDVCRCCLSTSGTLDLTASYITDVGVKQVYGDVIHECFGLTLSFLSEWGPSRLICDHCVSHLRDATAFKKQVQRADQLFTLHFSNADETISVKIEDLHDPGGYDDDFETYFEDDPKTNLDEKLKPTKPQKESNRKRQKTAKVKRKGIKILDLEYDSDIPIADLKKNLPSEKFVKDENRTEPLFTKENELKSRSIRIQFTKNVPNTKQKIEKRISERKRIVLTCGIVLKDTTACPFRHHKSWFQCFFCTNDFMEIDLLRKHTLESHKDIDLELKRMKRYPRHTLQIDITKLQCLICHANLTDVDSMRRHFEIVHNKIIYNECIADYKVNSSPYSCHLCSKEFHVFRTLTMHLNEHYANCICDICGRSFLNSKRLKVHKRTTHESGDFPCHECGKVLKTQTAKANHMESHSKRVIKCQICLKPMKHYNDRIKHMSEVHDITHKFQCRICFKEYNIKHYLATHMRQTHGNKNKKCSECGMAFITNHGLKKHMSKHTGERAYKCSVCGKAYARSYTLREHMRAHENDRFLCAE